MRSWFPAVKKVCPTSHSWHHPNVLPVLWGPTYMRAASDIWQTKTADSVPPAKRKAFKDKNMAWRAAMSDSAEDTYYLGELRHALSNIVSQHPALVLTQELTHLDSQQHFPIARLPWHASSSLMVARPPKVGSFVETRSLTTLFARLCLLPCKT